MEVGPYEAIRATRGADKGQIRVGDWVNKSENALISGNCAI